MMQRKRLLMYDKRAYGVSLGVYGVCSCEESTTRDHATRLLLSAIFFSRTRVLYVCVLRVQAPNCTQLTWRKK